MHMLLQRIGVLAFILCCLRAYAIAKHWCARKYALLPVPLLMMHNSQKRTISQKRTGAKECTLDQDGSYLKDVHDHQVIPGKGPADSGEDLR